MNKKIYTLLAAGLMGGLSVSAAPAGYTKNNLHQLGANGKVLSVVQSKVSSADSLVMIKAPTDIMSDAYKKTLWKITESNVDNTTTTVYTFTNYVTGKVLSLNLAKTDGTIAAGQSNWLISATNQLTSIKNGVEYGVYLTTVKEDDGVTPVVLPDGTNDYKVCVSKTADNAAQAFGFSQPADITYMSKNEINGLYGTSSSFSFSKKAEGNPIDGVAFRAEADANIPGYVNLHLNDGKYLVVDTAVWKNAVNTNSYWKLTTDAKPANAAASGVSTDVATATVLENGRAAETYAFKVSLSIKTGYKLTITPYAVPVYANTSEDSGKQTVFSYDVVTTPMRALSYGQFASSTLVLTASQAYSGDNLEVASAVFGTVETPNALDGKYTYYIQDYNTYNAAGSARNKQYTNYIYYSDCDDAVLKAKSAVATPGNMWYLTSAGSLVNMLDNTAAGTTIVGSITLIDEANSIYAFGSDTLKLTKGPKVVDARKMGYKTVSAADEANGALSFRLVSALAQDLYVVEDKSGVLYVANGELSDALKLKVVSTESDVDGDGVLDYATLATSNGVIKPTYRFTDRLANRYLVTDAEGTGFALLTNDKITDLNTNTDPDDDVDFVEASFLSVGNDDEYKIVFVNRYMDELAFTANAASGIMTSTFVCDEENIIFEFAKKDAPVYAAPKYGHVQITTLEDDNKMIAPQLDGFAALKAEGQVLKSDVYTNDTLKLWLDTALVDEIKPLYYLSSSAFNEEGDLRNYLINPSNIAAADAKANALYAYTSLADSYRAAFTPAAQDEHKCLVLGEDTISTIELNPATIAFEVAAEISEDAYRLVSPLDEKNSRFNPANPIDATNLPYVVSNDWYLAQLNNVLFWTQDADKAEVFVINRTTAPTANEAVVAETVKVIGGQGVVTVQGAAGKVVTVANILGQTLANQVAASDNVTIAVPAGIVVVAVDGEATKVVVK